MKQKNNILYIRTSKTASSSTARWCRLNQIKVTDNLIWLSDPKNKSTLEDKSFNVLITTVRNPYRRAYSQYKYFIKDKRWNEIFKPKSFKEFLEYDFKKISNKHCATHMTPVAYYLGPYLNKIDHFIKAERLYEDIQIICDLYDLKVTKDQNIFYETHYHKPDMDKEFEDKTIRDLCYNKFKDDFFAFNYSYDDWTNLYPEQSFLKQEKDEPTVKL